MNKNIKRLVILLSVVLLGYGGYYAKNWYFQATLIHPQEMLALEIPIEIRDLLLKDQMPPYSSVLRVANNKIFLASALPRKKLFHRTKVLLRTLEKITEKETIPDGYYLISVGDSIDKPLSYPILAFAGPKALADQGHIVLFPDDDAQKGYQKLFRKIDEGINSYPWEQKEAKLFWRGATTGYISFATKAKTPRAFFLEQTKNLSFVDAGFTSYVQFSTKEEEETFGIHYPLKNKVPEKESLKYKYLVDIDGNSCSYSRMAWILYSNSLLLKHKSKNVQWYYSLLQENVHYLPLEEDFSNVADQFEWAEKNQSKVHAIIANANDLARKVFSDEAILQGTLNALKSYQKLIQSELKTTYATPTR